MTKRQRRAELSNEEDSRAPRKSSKMRKHDSTDHLTEGSSNTGKLAMKNGASKYRFYIENSHRFSPFGNIKIPVRHWCFLHFRS